MYQKTSQKPTVPRNEIQIPFNLCKCTKYSFLAQRLTQKRMQNALKMHNSFTQIISKTIFPSGAKCRGGVLGESTIPRTLYTERIFYVSNGLLYAFDKTTLELVFKE